MVTVMRSLVSRMRTMLHRKIQLIDNAMIIGPMMIQLYSESAYPAQHGLSIVCDMSAVHVIITNSGKPKGV